MKTLADLINKWTSKSEWESLALDLATIFPPLLLQKSGKHVAAKEAKATISRRLELWEKGEIRELLKEGQTLQDRLPKSIIATSQNHSSRIFARLILQGKVRAALRLLSETENGGVAKPSPIIFSKLQEKHPQATTPPSEVLLPGLYHPVPPSLFDSLNGQLIHDVAMRSTGAAGPYGLDAADYRTLLCSKYLGNGTNELCEAIAQMARRLSTSFVDPNPLSTFLSCRLVPLEKGAGDIRPIGIGETLRRIIGKAVTRVLKPEIQMSCGNLQVCAGQEGGCEAAIHSMREMLEDERNEAALLIDASNAFNSTNRIAALHNISILCPAFFPFLCNTYRVHIRLFVPAWKTELSSQEGTTQGDPAAMPMYALSVVPLLSQAQSIFCRPGGQVWYADDATGVDKLCNLRRWWDHLSAKGPLYGYFPKATKTILVIKPQHLESAKKIFDGTGIKIETGGTRHLGGALGTREFQIDYAKEKIKQLTGDLKTLSKFAETEPQAAYAAFTHGFHGKWTFLQRVIPDIADLFLPLEEELSANFIPKITGRILTNIEREIVALPARLGGLGLRNPALSSNDSFEASKQVTQPLRELILKQEPNFEEFDDDKLQELKKEVVHKKRAKEKEEKKKIITKLKEQNTETVPKKKKPPDLHVRILECASQKGTAAWLTAMPNDDHVLNKQEWKDAMALRYGWIPANFPQKCSCGSDNSIQHALDCKLGGFIHLRHNRLRDLFADMLKKAGCKAIQIEQQLLPDEGELQGAPKCVERGDEARMDVTAIGFWGAWQRAFFDVRVFNPLAPSYVSQDLTALTKRHENEKKHKYGLRIQEIEKGSFTPLVFTTFGGCGKECDLALKRLGNLISEKTSNTP